MSLADQKAEQRIRFSMRSTNTKSWSIEEQPT